MKFSQRVLRVQPSATLAVNAKALELKEKGIPVTNLALGEPDFPTPEHIKTAAKQAIDDNFSRYTAVPGIMEARQAVCDYFHSIYGVESAPANIMLTNGGKHSLFNLFLALLDDGDDVLIPQPYWTSYPDMVLLAGGNPVSVPTTVENGFRLTIEALDAAYTKKTTVIILNSPSNPTGVTYTAEELDAIAQWAMDHNVFIVADEIYDQLVFAPAKPASLSPLWQRNPERIAIVNGVSKTFAMTGWRVGYTLAHADLIKQMSKIQSQVTSNICSISQKAALMALTSSYEEVVRMRDVFSKRRDLAYGEISSWPGVKCPKAEGAFYLFPDVSSVFTADRNSGAALCTYLMETAQVAVTPGEAFGDENCIRLSFAVADDVLQEALIRMRKALFN